MKNLPNPNQLSGHEGKLIQALNELEAYVPKQAIPNKRSENKAVSISGPSWKPANIPRGKVVMFLASEEQKDTGQGWIDVLDDQSKKRIFCNVRMWMTMFIPWPDGAFIYRD